MQLAQLAGTFRDTLLFQANRGWTPERTLCDIMMASLHDAMNVDPIAARRDVKASLGKTPVSSLKKREISQIAANLKLSEC